jgi:hypothetical protein
MFVACAYVALVGPLLLEGADPQGFDQTFDWAGHSGVMWVTTAVLVALLSGFTKRKRKAIRYALGVPHAVAHVVGALLATSLATLVTQNWSGTALGLGNVVLIGVFGSVIGSTVFCVYLLLANLFTGTHGNEIFSGLHTEGYDNFLRLQFRDDQVTVHPIALDKVGRHWRARPDGAPEDPWLVPEHELLPRFVEAPFVVTREASGAERLTTPDVDKRSALGRRPS